MTPSEAAKRAVEKMCAESGMHYLLCVASDEEKLELATIIDTEFAAAADVTVGHRFTNTSRGTPGTYALDKCDECGIERHRHAAAAKVATEGELLPFESQLRDAIIEVAERGWIGTTDETEEPSDRFSRKEFARQVIENFRKHLSTRTVSPATAEGVSECCNAAITYLDVAPNLPCCTKCGSSCVVKTSVSETSARPNADVSASRSGTLTVAQIREARAAITPGKWGDDFHGTIGVIEDDGEWGSTVTQMRWTLTKQDRDNAEWIANSPAFVDYLLDRLATVEGERAQDLEYAGNIAKQLVTKHCPDNTEFHLLGTVNGVLSQIDNVTVPLGRYETIAAAAELRGQATMVERAAQAMCSMCADPQRYAPARQAIEGSQRLFHVQLSDNWNAGPCPAQPIRALSPLPDYSTKLVREVWEKAIQIADGFIDADDVVAALTKARDESADSEQKDRG